MEFDSAQYFFAVRRGPFMDASGVFVPGPGYFFKVVVGALLKIFTPFKLFDVGVFVRRQKKAFIVGECARCTQAHLRKETQPQLALISATGRGVFEEPGFCVVRTNAQEQAVTITDQIFFIAWSSSFYLFGGKFQFSPLERCCRETSLGDYSGD